MIPLWILALTSALIIYMDIATSRIPNRLLVVVFLCLMVDPNPFYGSTFLVMMGVILVLTHLRVYVRRASFSPTPRLGYGDIKLMLVLSLGIPLAHLPLFLIFSGLGGLLTFGIRRLIIHYPPPPFPLGPALIIAFWISRSYNLEFFVHAFSKRSNILSFFSV